MSQYTLYVSVMIGNKDEVTLMHFISFYSLNRTEVQSIAVHPFIALVGSSAGLETGRSGAFA
jgi:hypothetical protein